MVLIGVTNEKGNYSPLGRDLAPTASSLLAAYSRYASVVPRCRTQISSRLVAVTRSMTRVRYIGTEQLPKKRKIMSAVKPTTILFVLLTGLSLSAWADSECAHLLAPSFQSRELSTEQKFRAYMVDLLEGGELGF